MTALRLLTYTYDAFGNLIASNGSTPNNFLYSAQQWDSDLGLYYNRARYLNTGIGRFWTMDGDYGNNEDPLSLHKYLYASDDPVDGSDPSGNDSLDSMSMPVYAAAMNVSAAPNGSVAIGGTCGPDISQKVELTILRIENLFGVPYFGNPMAVAASSGILDNPIKFYKSGWDVYDLNELAHGGRPDFGNESRLGTGTGAETVQVSGHVYYAGSVNYFLWGLIMGKLHENLRNPLSGAYDPTLSESAAVAAARLHKAAIGNFSDDYEKEAIAWTRFGYTQTEDPSSTALDLDTTLKPDSSNVGDSVSMDWKWLGLHNDFAP